MVPRPSQGKGARKTKGDDSTADEGLMKVKRTIGWYNKHGGLASPIIYKNARMSLEAIDPRAALSILSGLKEKGPTIRDPTAWLKKAAARMAPDLDPKVKRTILWYNQHGGLPAQIHYDEVKAPLAALPAGTALSILSGLKNGKVQDPTWWLIGAAQKAIDRQRTGGGGKGSSSWSSSGAAAPTMSAEESEALAAANAAAGAAAGLEQKVLKTVTWYNKHGGLLQPIDLSSVAPALAQIGTQGTLELLKGLDGKGHTIKNPSSWLLSAAQRKLQG